MRVGRKISRTTLLIRPAIFILIRIGTFIVRAVQAGGDESEGLFIAQQVSSKFHSAVYILTDRLTLADPPPLWILPPCRTFDGPRQVQPISRLDPARQEGSFICRFQAHAVGSARRSQPRYRRELKFSRRRKRRWLTFLFSFAKVGARTNDSFTDSDLARTLKRCR